MVHKRKYGLLLPLIIILFVCAAAATMEEEKALKTIEVHVEVRNNLPPGNKFTIHCKSKNDDLGVNTMAPNQVYAFHFHISIWGNTLLLQSEH
ncbi:hypothetical protein SAY86_009866 [Trapa natans]|uniref:S-protein homolog n=1 Tax=Trapa natans TaxID=22666 RepID=A0AAN7QRK1_TRANT|nr:hypothetical protein SAY86_009866 [Trapa natans]